MSTDRLEVKPDANNQTLEQSAEQLKEEGESLGLEGEQLEHFVDEQFEQRAG